MTNLILLADFSVIKPDVGLLFWTTIVFLFVWFMLSKFAFKPIQSALKDRNESIQDALDEAKKAKEEMASLQAKNETILKEAQEERAKIIREAKEMKESMINDAKAKAKEEANKIVATAKVDIDNQKMAAMADAKNHAGSLALEIAEKIIKKELKGNGEHQTFVNSLVDEIKLN